MMMIIPRLASGVKATSPILPIPYDNNNKVMIKRTW